MNAFHFGRHVRLKLAEALPGMPVPTLSLTKPGPQPFRPATVTSGAKPPAPPKPPEPAAPKGTSYLDTLDRWYNPWTKQQVTDWDRNNGMRVGQIAMGTGLAAGAAAGGLAAAAPAVANMSVASLPGAAVSAAKPAIGAYRAATSPLGVHAAKALPQAVQPAAKAMVQGFGAGATLGQLNTTYNQAADSVMTTAQNMARSTGITDQKVLDEVGSRARGQMLPMAYRAMAPTWAGGDATEVGKQIRGSLGTVAQNNIVPVLTRPSQAAANWTPGQRAMHASIGNPVGAVTSAFVPPRPSAQQMWQNVPQDQRKQMTTNLMSAALEPDAGGSSLAKGMQHIFAPAVQHQQEQLSQQLNSLGSSLAAYTR